MKKILLLLLCSIFVFNKAIADTVSTYTLYAGDMIAVNVFGEEDLSVEARLSDAGTISYPFLGEIRARGLTVGQLAKLIGDRLRGDYLVNPRVNITIVEYRKFFVYGQVNKPGGFSFEPGLTLEKAVALAGGFSPRASKNSVDVTREIQGRKVTVKMLLDKPVLPGDIVNVKESFF